MIGAIFAVGDDGAFGNAGMIPWYYPEDFKHFKRTTMGGKIVMGRNTWESLPGVLPNRDHIVLSTSMSTTPDVRVYPDMDALLHAEGNNFWVIGGPSVLKLFGDTLGYDVVYMTTVFGSHPHDVSLSSMDIIGGLTPVDIQAYDGFQIAKFTNERKF